MPTKEDKQLKLSRRERLRWLAWGAAVLTTLLVFLPLYLYTLHGGQDRGVSLPADGPAAAMKGVIELQSHNYDEVIGQSKYVLVEFYATWCGHCRRFAPEFERLAEMVQRDGRLRGRLVLGRLESRRVRQLASEFAVTSYPSLFLVRPFEKTGVLCKEGWEPERIMAYLRRKIE